LWQQQFAFGLQLMVQDASDSAEMDANPESIRASRTRARIKDTATRPP
jgi:hypothetical protein